MREFSSWDHWARLLVSCGNALFFLPFRLLFVLGGGSGGGGCNNTQGSFLQKISKNLQNSPGWISSAGRPRRSRSRSCWPPPETCLPSPAAWPGQEVSLPLASLRPAFPNFRVGEEEGDVLQQQDSVLLTGLAFPLAEKAAAGGSQLLLDV